MILRSLFYRTLPVWVALAALLPPSMHPGKRASRVMRELGIAPGLRWRRFEFRLFLSLWRSLLLLEHGFKSSVARLHRFLRTRVIEHGTRSLEEIAAMSGGVILAAPHYGAFIPACLRVIQAMHGHKRFNVIFNDPKVTPSNAPYGELFARLGCDVTVLYPDRRGTMAALKALKRGECLAILPDVYFESETTIAVPFFGRLLRVMAGTAFFASRTGAPIVPIYGIPSTSMGMELRVGQPIDPAAHTVEDEAQTLFNITAAMMGEMEDQFIEAPEHWNYWDSLRHRSTRLLSARAPSHVDHLSLLSDKLADAPVLFREIPQLAEHWDALRRGLATEK